MLAQIIGAVQVTIEEKIISKTIQDPAPFSCWVGGHIWILHTYYPSNSNVLHSMAYIATHVSSYITKYMMMTQGNDEESLFFPLPRDLTVLK